MRAVVSAAGAVGVCGVGRLREAASEKTYRCGRYVPRYWA